MATFAVRFEGQEHSLTIGTIKTGVPIYTVHVEADSEEAALERVRMTLEPDTGNFTNWETGLA